MASWEDDDMELEEGEDSEQKDYDSERENKKRDKIAADFDIGGRFPVDW